MVKVTINGETFSFDPDRYPMAEAIELEEKLGMPFHQYKVGLARGSAKALAGLVWLVLKRNGKDVPLDDILSGAYELDHDEIGIEQEGGEDPTGPPSPADGGPGSASSPSDSGSGRGSGSGSPSRKSTS